MQNINKLSTKDTMKLLGAIIALAKEQLITFAKYTFSGYGEPKHLVYLADKLQKVEQGIIKRLIVLIHPRSGKSELVSKIFPAWYLGRNPDNRIIHASYEANLSNTFSRGVRDWIKDKRYRLVFPIMTKENAESVHNWEIANHRGGFISAGVGGGVTGFGANLFLIDDPIKNREQAESKVIREKQWEWFRSVARTRLEPNAAVIVMMARWHQEDLVGKLIKEMTENGGEKWDVINLLPYAGKDDVLDRKEGELLWPERFTKENYSATKSAIGTRNWLSLYEGNPQSPEDQIIQEEWTRKDYEVLPDLKKFIRVAGIDTATSLKDTACNSALVTIYSDMKKENIYIEDVFMDKISVRGLSNHTNSAHQARKYHRIELEENAAGDAIRQDMKLVNKLLPIHGFSTTTDKRVRLYELQPYFEAGKILFNKNNKKVQNLKSHLLNFDSSDVKDDVDALGFAVKALEHIRVLGKEESIIAPKNEGEFEINV